MRRWRAMDSASAPPYAPLNVLKAIALDQVRAGHQRADRRALGSKSSKRLELRAARQGCKCSGRATRLRDGAIIYGGLIGRSWLLAALSARPINQRARALAIRRKPLSYGRRNPRKHVPMVAQIHRRNVVIVKPSRPSRLPPTSRSRRWPSRLAHRLVAVRRCARYGAGGGGGGFGGLGGGGFSGLGGTMGQPVPA
jgi:hypothetical protein